MLAACTWNQPHILVMDEPTNYLDRCDAGEGGGALRTGADFWGGGGGRWARQRMRGGRPAGVRPACSWMQPPSNRPRTCPPARPADAAPPLPAPPSALRSDSLGALAGAIREFGGGVVIISHHNEFTSALCPEKWTVGGGKVDVTGAPQVMTKEKVEFTVQEEVIDAFGNTIKVKGPKKKLSRKEAKAAKKARDARRARGEDVTDSEEEEE